MINIKSVVTFFFLYKQVTFFSFFRNNYNILITVWHDFTKKNCKILLIMK